MMLAVLDASPVAGGPVTRALASAASEAGGSTVRVRLYDLLGTACAGCGACRDNARCSRRHPQLDAAITRIVDADALLVGASGQLHAADPRVRALLERLAGAFARVETRRGIACTGSARSGARRAALLCSAPWLLGMPAALGILPAGLGRVWSVLDRAGVEVVGCASVATRWSGPASWDRTTATARRLGRALAGERARRSHRSPALPPAAVPTTLRPAVAAARIA